MLSTTYDNTNMFQPACTFQPAQIIQYAPITPIEPIFIPTITTITTITVNGNFGYTDTKLMLKQLMLTNGLKVEDLIKLMEEMAIEEVLDS